MSRLLALLTAALAHTGTAHEVTPPPPAKPARPARITGYRLQAPDGTTYVVTASGAWRRITPRRFAGRVGMTKAAERRNRKGI